MGRPKGSKNKKNMSEEIKNPDDLIVELTPPVVPVETASTDSAAPVFAGTVDVAEPTPPDISADAVVAGITENANTDGFKSCTKCGRDESAAFPLTVKDNAKLCSNCL